MKTLEQLMIKAVLASQQQPLALQQKSLAATMASKNQLLADTNAKVIIST